MASVFGSPPLWSTHTTSSSSSSRQGGCTVASRDGVPSSDSNNAPRDPSAAESPHSVDLESRKADILARNTPLSSSYSRSTYVLCLL